LPPGYRLAAFGSVVSTNDIAARHARMGDPEGLVVVADAQSGGRGRHGRAWSSPAGNLYCSVLLRPGCAMSEAAQISLLVALAVADAVDPIVSDPGRIRLKWPNDVLLDCAKLAGILLEGHARADGASEWVVAGCGINIASHPETPDYPAVSLDGAGLGPVSIPDLLGGYVTALDRWLHLWRSERFAPVRKAWLERAFGLGRTVAVRLPDGPVEGRFVDLAVSGALEIEELDGARRQVSAGDVFFSAA
jgi:BirA family biotin operon repressor/biotin-[acetyl-CoA-carboxylase] ligase